MKCLKDYEKTLKTCSKCGLCQSVCPVYKVTGKETIVSRGKFNLLLGLIKGDLKYTKNLDKALSLCLNCKACDNFCPSSIKATEIICAAKQENKQHCHIFNNIFFHKFGLVILGLIFKTYRFSHFSLFVPKIKKFIKVFGILGTFFILFDKISKINVKRKKTTKDYTIGQDLAPLKVIYFEGCYTKYLNPSVKNAVLNLLEKNNITVIQPSFDCCGLSALYKGDYKLFQKYKNKNIKLLSQDCDYIVCDCATCHNALKEYGEEISKKVVDISELLSNIKIDKNDNITYHLPCHIREDKDKIISIIKNLSQNYKEMTDYDVCCGFSGEFSLKFPKISQQISSQKAENIKNTNAEYVLTSCPGCVIGLNKGLIENNEEKTVLNVAEYLELNS